MYFKSSLLTLDQLVYQFGWSRLKAKDLIRLEQLRQKFCEKIRFLTGVEFINTYSLADIGHIEDAGLIDSYQRAVLLELIDRYTTSKSEIDRTRACIHRVYKAKLKAITLEMKESLDSLTNERNERVKAAKQAGLEEALHDIYSTFEASKARIQSLFNVEKERIEAGLLMGLVPLDQQMTDLKAEMNARYTEVFFVTRQ